MNLQTEIRPELWNSIRPRWDSRDFSGAILDAVYFLSDLIREKADLEGDGVPLVGQAFGGANPRIKVTKLHTESDRNIQAGVLAILRGVYQAIRNPRSHEKIQDSEADAAAIIVFINYLVGMIGASRSVFSHQEFLERIFDKGFVAHQRYAELLVDEIPSKKKLNVCVDVFRQRVHGDGKKLRYFFDVFLPQLEEGERGDFFQDVSDELKSVDNRNAIIGAVQALPPSSWKNIEEIAKLRIENMLLESIEDGRLVERTGKCRSGGFGTWARRIVPYFSLDKRLETVLIRKLTSSDPEERAYVLKFFFDVLCDRPDMPSPALETAVMAGLKAGDVRFKEAVELAYIFSDREWSQKVKQTLDDFEEEFAPVTERIAGEDDLPF